MKIKILITCLLLCCFNLNAQNKVATVDTIKLMNALREDDSESKNIQSEKDKIRKELQNKKDELQKIEKEIREKKLGKESAQVKEFQTKIQDYEKVLQEKDEDLRKRTYSLYKKLSDQAYTAIREYAEANGIILVLDKSSDSPGPVLYGKSGADITNEVMEKLNL